MFSRILILILILIPILILILISYSYFLLFTKLALTLTPHLPVEKSYLLTCLTFTSTFTICGVTSLHLSQSLDRIKSKINIHVLN